MRFRDNRPTVIKRTFQEDENHLVTPRRISPFVERMKLREDLKSFGVNASDVIMPTSNRAHRRSNGQTKSAGKGKRNRIRLSLKRS